MLYSLFFSVTLSKAHLQDARDKTTEKGERVREREASSKLQAINMIIVEC